jgi:hypothetical protein
VWKSLKEEFKKLYLLNGQYMPEGKVSFAGSTDQISREDFLGDPSAIVPVADPNILSDQQIFMQGQVLMGVAKNNPLYNQDAVNVKFLKGLKISNIDQIYLGTKRAGHPQPTEKVQIELLKAQVQLKELELKKLQFISSLMEQRRLNEAKIVSLYAQAALFEEQAGGVQAATDIQAFQAKIDALKVLNDGIDQQIQAAGVMGNANTGNNAEAGGSAAGGVPAVEGTSSNGTGNAMAAGTPPGVNGTVG